MSKSAGDVSGISFEWVHSIEKITKKQWDKCFPGNDVLRSYPFQLSLEKANMPITFHYLRACIKGEVLVITPCFEYRYSIVGLSKGPLEVFSRLVKKLLPNLFSIRLFVVGSPVAICKDLIGCNPEFETLVYSERVLQEAFGEIDRKCKLAGVGLIIVKEMTSDRMEVLKESFPENMFYAESPATTYVYTGKGDGLDFSSRMLSRHRKLYKGRKSKFCEAGLRWETRYEFEQYAKQMHQLYTNVVNKSSIKFERLTPQFFFEVSKNLPKASFALLCFKGDQLVAFELVLQGDELHPVYLGMDYAFRDSASLYFNCVYRTIEEAETRQLPYVELGQTSYEAKAGVGAVTRKLYLGLMHRNPIFNRILKVLKNQLFPITEIPEPRRIFKNNDVLLEMLEENGVSYESKK